MATQEDRLLAATVQSTTPCRSDSQALQQPGSLHSIGKVSDLLVLASAGRATVFHDETWRHAHPLGPRLHRAEAIVPAPNRR